MNKIVGKVDIFKSTKYLNYLSAKQDNRDFRPGAEVLLSL